MYNNNFKYYIKALIGRKNDMWYFDKLQKSYPKNNQRDVNELISWADKVSNEQFDESFYIKNGFVKNYAYPLAEELRNLCLQNFQNIYEKNGLAVCLHLPPENVSVGGRSWMQNFGSALKFMGINVIYFWNDLPVNDLKEKNIILSIGAKKFVESFNWDSLAIIKKSSSISLGFQCSTDITNEKTLNKYIEEYLQYKPDFFYSFHSASFVETTALKTISEQKDFKVFSIEFSANPLLNFPQKYIKQDFDFVFLGSSNHDKINRYYQYFLQPFKQFKGCVAGPGWKWTPDFKLNHSRDSLVYSRSKVALNLHIDFQMIYANEINERAYQIASYGIPQIIDNPRILNEKFSRIGLVAKSPKEFLSQIKYALNNLENLEDISKKAMIEVYEKHTTFHRVKEFIENFYKINNI